MKKKTIAMIGVPFILGAVFGFSIFATLSFVSPENPSSPAPVEITATEANHYFYNYFNGADSIKDKFKGFLMDRSQLDAVNLLAKDPALVGFRLYMGKSNTGEKIGIVVGISGTFSDATGGKIYKTDSKNSGPCPTQCDVSSPITRKSD